MHTHYDTQLSMLYIDSLPGNLFKVPDYTKFFIVNTWSKNTIKTVDYVYNKKWLAIGIVDNCNLSRINVYTNTWLYGWLRKRVCTIAKDVVFKKLLNISHTGRCIAVLVSKFNREYVYVYVWDKECDMYHHLEHTSIETEDAINTVRVYMDALSPYNPWNENIDMRITVELPDGFIRRVV